MFRKRGFFLLFVILLFLSIVYGLTFEDLNQSNFNNGTYVNATYNGSAVILSANNLSGDFTSRIFDAAGPASWDNFSVSRSLSNLTKLFIVDGAGDVYSSSDAGGNWSQVNKSYGGGSATADMGYDLQDNLYIILNQNIYKSTDKGILWNIATSDFGPGDPSNGFVIATSSNNSLFLADGNGDVWISTNGGINWTNQGDFNGASGANPKGIAINSTKDLFVVDGNGAVWRSLNSGVSWTQQNASFGGTSGTDDLAVDSSGNLYILFNRNIYKSTNQGVSWTIINNTFSNDQDGLTMIIDSIDRFFIADPSGDIYRSTDFAVNWTKLGDFNGAATNDAKGFTFLDLSSNISFQARNCSSNDCTDASFKGPDDTANSYFTNLSNSLNLRSRYFQYKAFFSREDSNLTSQLFNVSIGYSALAPTISITSPTNDQAFSTNISLPLNFTITNASSLGNCWYNLNNGVNNTILNCQNTIFNTSDGNYELKIFANDSLGNQGTNSVNFSVSATSISLVLSQPSGTKTSRTGIPIEFTIVGNNLTCWYNVAFSIGTSVIGNTTLNNCANSSFDVSTDGNYIFNLYSNNSLGKSNSSSSSFTVDTSSGGNGAGTGGGGGGGGSSRTVNTNPNVNNSVIKIIGDILITDIPNTLVTPGEVKRISAGVKNTGLSFLNKCKLKGVGERVEWVLSSGEKNLGGGESIGFDFDLNIPKNLQAGIYNIEIEVICNEKSGRTSFNAEILEKQIDFKLIETVREGVNNIRIFYSLEDFSGVDQDVQVQFLLYDSSNEKISEFTEEVRLNSNTKQEFQTLIPINRYLVGNYNLLINLNSDEYSNFMQESLFLTPGFQGLAIFNIDEQKNKIFILIFGIVFFAFAIFIILRILKFRKKSRRTIDYSFRK